MRSVPNPVSAVRAALLEWYDRHGRALAWRAPPGAPPPDPYRVWLSEVMLQQTTTPHATPYFEAFTARWPTVGDLAAADDSDVMAAWAGLGYYARARNLLACARAVARDHGGVFPDTEAGLLALPVLAGSAAYAVGELRGWRTGLEHRPENARAFYGVIALSFGFGLLMLFLPIDPIKALFWSAVLNGLIAVPLMIATMLVVSSRRHLGAFVAPVGLRIMGWLATAVMAGAALLMFIL
jgi:hypothetical protein